MAIVTLMLLLMSVRVSQTSELHLGLNEANYAGREFIFTFGDNRPEPQPILFIAAYNTEEPVNCTITYHLDSFNETKQIVVGAQGVLEKPPKEVVIHIRKDIDRIPPLTGYKSIHLQSDADVVVYGFSSATFSTDAFLALPTDVLGTSYVIPSSPHVYTHLNATSLIVVTSACPQPITINYKFPTKVGFHHPISLEWSQSDQLSLTLDKFQTVSFLADTDLSGTEVTTDCIIAVMSGNKKGSIGHGTGDHMYEMIPPISRLGSSFITTPLFRKNVDDHFKLIGAKDNTSCVLRNVSYINNEQTTLNLNKGEVYSMDIALDQYMKIECSAPALLTQYAKSGNKKTDGDPFMTLVPSLVQFENYYKIINVQPIKRKNIRRPFRHYISILIETEELAGLKVDGVYLWRENATDEEIKIKKSVQIPGINYTHIVLRVSDGVHQLQHDVSSVTFGVLVYGLKISESYGYPGGMRLPLSGSDCRDEMMTDNNKDCDGLVGEIDADNTLYPVADIPQSVPRAIPSHSRPRPNERNENISWYIILLITLVAVAAMLAALAAWFHVKKSHTKPDLGLPVAFQNRFSPSRISIRSVWTAKKKPEK